jgi:hypothetical protein
MNWPRSTDSMWALQMGQPKRSCCRLAAQLQQRQACEQGSRRASAAAGVSQHGTPLHEGGNKCQCTQQQSSPWSRHAFVMSPCGHTGCSWHCNVLAAHSRARLTSVCIHTHHAQLGSCVGSRRVEASKGVRRQRVLRGQAGQLGLGAVAGQCVLGSAGRSRPGVLLAGCCLTWAAGSGGACCCTCCCLQEGRCSCCGWRSSSTCPRRSPVAAGDLLLQQPQLPIVRVQPQRCPAVLYRLQVLPQLQVHAGAAVQGCGTGSTGHIV